MPPKAARIAKLDKGTRDAKLDALALQVKKHRADAKANLAGLPAAGSRTNAQRKDADTYKAIRDLSLYCLMLAGEADAATLVDGTD